MPHRATKRGAARTPFAPGADADVLVCGASFAGLAVARELRGAGASVLVLDRYEVGERQTSACAAPTQWLRALDLDGSIRQTFGSLLVHTPRVRGRWPLPWTFSTFDYRTLCGLLFEQATARFDIAKVDGRTGATVHTDRGDVSAPLVVDALGWRRVLGLGENVQPPEATLSRGLEVHPGGSGADLELWIDPRYVDAGYGWSFPARDELRIGVGSFEPHDHLKEPTLRLVAPVRAAPGRGPLGPPGPREGAGAGGGGRRRGRPGALSGHLDPPSAALRDRGRGLLRRRPRGPLPAADRGGHPHGAVLRHRVRARTGRR